MHATEVAREIQDDRSLTGMFLAVLVVAPAVLFFVLLIVFRVVSVFDAVPVILAGASIMVVPAVLFPGAISVRAVKVRAGMSAAQVIRVRNFQLSLVAGVAASAAGLYGALSTFTMFGQRPQTLTLNVLTAAAVLAFVAALAVAIGLYARHLTPAAIRQQLTVEPAWREWR